MKIHLNMGLFNMYLFNKRFNKRFRLGKI